MAYELYLGKTLYPVTPSKIETKIKGQNKTITLINEGEVNILKQPGLTDISFDLLLPNVKYPFATYKSGFKNAKHFLDKLEKAKVEKKKFQFILTRILPNGKMLFDTNMKVSLEDYIIKEDRDEGFDVIVSIKLKQYKDFGTKTCDVKFEDTKPKVSTTNGGRAKKETTENKTHTVKKGDCLWNLAKKYYGDGTKHTTIYKANKTVIESTAKKNGKKSSENGKWIYPGTKLTIPGV